MGKTAPHKAVMLISVIDLIRNGLISGEEIYFGEKLQRMFEMNWRRYVGESILFKPVPATPFWHLGNEPFWHLTRNDGGRLDEIKNTPTAGGLDAMNVVASIDKELIELLKNESACDKLHDLLVDEYLSSPKPQLKKVLPLFVGVIAPRIFI